MFQRRNKWPALNAHSVFCLLAANENYIISVSQRFDAAGHGMSHSDEKIGCLN